MSEWTKGDGAKIQLTFTEPLIGDVSGNQSHFTVTIPEYDMVPEGKLSNVVKTVKSTYGRTSYSQTVALSSGTLTDLSISNGKLSLGVA